MTENNVFMISDKLDTPGEHEYIFSGPAGELEITLTVPQNLDKHYIAILGHPHSLQGGTMNNKVVTTLARAFKELNIISLRFNFRGVGQSAGKYDEGIGESEDMLFLAQHCLQEMPGVKILFAGFSFGSYVAYRSAAQFEHSLLITVAPSVEHYDYAEFSKAPAPWVVIHGDMDEVVAVKSVIDFVAQSHPTISLLRFAHTGHFFHGKLIELKEHLHDIIRKQVKLI